MVRPALAGWNWTSTRNGKERLKKPGVSANDTALAIFQLLVVGDRFLVVYRAGFRARNLSAPIRSNSSVVVRRFGAAIAVDILDPTGGVDFLGLYPRAFDVEEVDLGPLGGLCV